MVNVSLEKKRINVLDTTKAHPLEVLSSCMMKQGRLVGIDTNYGNFFTVVVILVFLGGALLKSGELLQKLSGQEIKFVTYMK